MATKSDVRHRPESRIALASVLCALLGGAAGCAGHAGERAAPTAPPPSVSVTGPDDTWPSYPVPDPLRSPAPDGWALPAPPTAGPTRAPAPHDLAPMDPVPPAGGPTSTMGGAGGVDGLVTPPSPGTAAPDRANGRRPEGYQRSLVYSGLLGLAIALIGIGMIGRRRQLW